MKSETLVIVVGLGKFLGAGRRIERELRNANKKLRVVVIDGERLSDIAGKCGVDPCHFHAGVRGYGFWQWKPLVIYYYSQVDRGPQEQIVYIDAGCEVFWRSFLCLVEWFSRSRYDIVVSRAGHCVVKFTKPEVLDYFGFSQSDVARIGMVQAGLVFLKTRSPVAEVFIDAFQFVRDGKIELFDDTLRNNEIVPDSFVEHRHDQSVLTMLLLRAGFHDSVGVLNTTLTPPEHRYFLGDPPVIAARNSSSLVLYDVLKKCRCEDDIGYGHRLQIRLAKKLIRSLNLPPVFGRIFGFLIAAQMKGRVSGGQSVSPQSLVVDFPVRKAE